MFGADSGLTEGIPMNGKGFFNMKARFLRYMQTFCVKNNSVWITKKTRGSDPYLTFREAAAHDHPPVPHGPIACNTHITYNWDCDPFIFGEKLI